MQSQLSNFLNINMFKIVIALLCVATLVKGTKFTVCKSSERAALVKLSITDCADDATECSFTIGKEYTFKLDINISAEHAKSDVLPYRITATIVGIPILIAHGDACEFDGVQCPIEPGTEIKVSVSKTIPKNARAFNKAKVTARVWNEYAKVNPIASFCASIFASVVKSKTSVDDI